MKIIASIAVEKIDYKTSYTFRSELRELNVVRVLRYRCDRTRERYHYEADVEDHPDMHPEIFRSGAGNAVRVNVTRRLNPKWKPPAFQDGVNVVVPNARL